MKASDFVNLHVHTEYSLLDGACRIKNLVEKVKNLGQKAVAITDHGNMYGVAEFWKAASDAGIKPVIGCEVYVAPRTRFDKETKEDLHSFHLILLCENNEGYRNLIKLVSLASIEGFYNRPRVDIDLLKKYHKGLICLSACLSGEIAKLLLNGQYEFAKQKVLQYLEIFGDGNYFIEVQNHGISDELRIIPQLYRLSKETGIPLAATNDCHYINKSDSEMQNVLICIQTRSVIGQENGMSFPNAEFYVKSADEMAELFKNHEEAVTNTVLIAERCNVDFSFDGAIKIPEFKPDIIFDGIDNNRDYLRKLSFDGLYDKYGNNVDSKIIRRLEYELEVINNKKFNDYFLIVWDFIRYAREHDIPVGPGRGSGAGSLCAYCIGITSIDPIKYNLMFERFLNPERMSMPDFDIDFCIEGRQAVKDYVSGKYGEDKVCEIIAFDTMKAKMAVRDIARVMGMPYSLGDRIAKFIDIKHDLSWSLNENKELYSLYQTDVQVRKLIDLALKLEGMPRHTSIHAAGVVISDIPLSDIVPLQKSRDTIITQYTMSHLESLGLLKMDFLGLRNLTVIRDAVNEICCINPNFDINNIPIDDGTVYEMLSRGDTSGVFQFESAGMTKWLIELMPERLEDLIVIISLYRPGPMKSIPLYINNKKNPQSITYFHPKLKEILSDTYGVMVYQEQVMEICRKLAGYSYSHADIVRRAMAKKKPEVMLKERESFVNGASENGVSENVSNKIFDEMVSFASYAFNKSHAAAYAYLAYQTAYLKCHYRGIYMASLMSSVMTGGTRLVEYISDCRNAGVEVASPHINRSVKNFTYSNGKVYFGLVGIKNVGTGFADIIIQERNINGKFTGLQNFCERIAGKELNKKAVENLIKSGAFDGLGLNRRQMLENYEIFIDTASKSERKIIEGQLNFFGNEDNESSGISVAYKPEYDKRRLYAMEMDSSGIYLSGSPLDEYNYMRELLKMRKVGSIISDENSENNTDIKLLCIVQDKKIHTSKNGSKMCFLTLADETGELDSIVFPNLYSVTVSKLNKEEIIFITGRISIKDESISLICENILSEQEFPSVIENMQLCIKTTSNNIPVEKISEICKKYSGNTEICFYFTDLGKKVKSKNRLSVELNEQSYNEFLKFIYAENMGLIKT